MPDAIVLGAGMAGVPTAVQLQRRGWSVALVDRQAPGLATSFGNAGIIQNEAVEPYAMPRDARSLFAIARGRTNDVHYSFRSLHRHLGPLLRYWWHSAPGRHRQAAAAYSRLIAAAGAEHEALIDPAGAAPLVRKTGFRIMHRTEPEMTAAAAFARRMEADYGVPHRLLSPRDLAAAEPSLREAGAGAVHWLGSWHVSDPGALVMAYADLFVRLGGALLRGDAMSLARQPGGGWVVRTADGDVAAEHVVVALGPWSVELLGRFGYRVPMVRKRGYHRHYGGASLQVPLMDSAHGYCLAPMAQGLRITTGAELSHPAAESDPPQLAWAERRARELIDLGGAVESEPWSGVRPCMPHMLPVVGRAARHDGVGLPLGHGHQGFTLGPVTARLLAELMTGETPFVDLAPFSTARYA